ncbi:hypothetical protein [Actinoplanes subtropicus]|uniref:hypothetical protein n=1 Tax=Actinoplanes subtropicus TaxID=543632 RepID=UPI0004C4048E|nr:hypothetical protein [Actinoplanes subtropicus]
MEPFALVNQAIDLLAAHLPSAAQVENAAAHGLYRLIADRLGRRNESEAMTEFVDSPRNNALVKRLVREAVRDDPQFAEELARAVAAVAAPAVSATVVHQSGNVAGGDIVGRDSIRTTTTNTSNAYTNNTNKKSNPVGVAIGVASLVVVALVVIFVLKAVAGAVGGGGLSGKSTCTEFLQSADDAAKAAVMKQLYLAKNKPQLAADPFINQNTEYFCGERPTMTLEHLADIRTNG